MTERLVETQRFAFLIKNNPASRATLSDTAAADRCLAARRQCDVATPHMLSPLLTDATSAQAVRSAAPNARALRATVALSTTWTVAQLVGAHLSNSSSLLSDALAMLVDDSA